MNRRFALIFAVAVAGALALVGVLSSTHDMKQTEETPLYAGKSVEQVSADSSLGQDWATFARGVEDWRRAAGIDGDDLARGNNVPGHADALATTRGAAPEGAGSGVVPTRIDNPGDEPWRLSGAKRETTVRGTRYEAPPGGQRVELTSGRQIGNIEIRLPDSVDVDLALAGRTSAPLRAEVCVDRSGAPDEVRVVEGTGVEGVDHYVAEQLLHRKYRPLRRNGRRVEFCERTTVIISG